MSMSEDVPVTMKSRDVTITLTSFNVAIDHIPLQGIACHLTFQSNDTYHNVGIL